MLIGFGVSLAHKSDIGGLVPGSSGAAAREIYHDGLLLPPVRFQTEAGIEDRSRRSSPTTAAWPRWCSATCVRRSAVPASGSAARRAVRGIRPGHRARGDGEPDGPDRAPCGRRAAAWPDRSAEAEGFLDHDGAVKDRPVRIHVRATKTGARLRLDFTGSAVQTIGPVNLVSATAEAASLLALLATCDPTIPVNFGLRAAVDFVLPKGTVVNARHPATVNLYFPTAHLVYNTVLSALGAINPARAVAPSGLGSGAVTIGYRKSRSGKPAVLYELLNTSLGGTSRNDGASAVMAMNHFTPGAPVEIFESEYPLRVRAFDMGAIPPAPAAIAAVSAMSANSRCWRTACSPCAPPITFSRPTGMAAGLAGRRPRGSFSIRIAPTARS